MTDPVSRRYAHFEGITYLCFDSNTRVVTCGHDCDVRIVEGDDSTEFSVSSDKLSAIVCYRNQDRQDIVAVAMDDYSVQAFKLDGSSEGLLMRFTAPVTYIAVNSNHTLLAAGSSEFIKVMELADTANTFNLIGHEAQVLCVKFDPKGELLASSSCDGSLKIWSLTAKECVETLSVLQKCNDTSLIKSLCCLSWQPKHGKTLAVPVGNEVKVYDRSSWKCLFTLSEDHHKEAMNVVSWSPCGRYVASGGADGSMCLWDVHSQKAYEKYNNVVFADQEGFVGVFEDVYPSNKPQSTNPSTLNDNDDTNLVMEVASQSRQLHLGQPLAVSDSHSLLGKSSLGSRREPMLHPHTSPKRLCTSSESSEQSNRSNTPDTFGVGVATITATNTPSITTSVTDTANPTQHLQECVDQALPLPREEQQVVKDKCTDLHFSDLVKADGQLWAHTVISRGAEGEGIEGELRRSQLQAIFDLPGEPLEPWGDNIDEVLENGDMCMWWVHVGFHVNDDPSDLLEYDLWMCAEVHHWHAPFVFPAGSDKMVLRYDPIEWIQKPTREDKGSAETLSELTEALIWSAFEDM